MPYMTNYEYCCKVNCDSTEKLIKKPASMYCIFLLNGFCFLDWILNNL